MRCNVVGCSSTAMSSQRRLRTSASCAPVPYACATSRQPCAQRDDDDLRGLQVRPALARADARCTTRGAPSTASSPVSCARAVRVCLSMSRGVYPFTTQGWVSWGVCMLLVDRRLHPGQRNWWRVYLWPQVQRRELHAEGSMASVILRCPAPPSQQCVLFTAHRRWLVVHGEQRPQLERLSGKSSRSRCLPLSVPVRLNAVLLQFFVTLEETAWLDGAHTVFGKVGVLRGFRTHCLA